MYYKAIKKTNIFLVIRAPVWRRSCRWVPERDLFTLQKGRIMDKEWQQITNVQDRIRRRACSSAVIYLIPFIFDCLKNGAALFIISLRIGEENT